METLDKDIEAILEASHAQPFAFLGLHQVKPSSDLKSNDETMVTAENKTKIAKNVAPSHLVMRTFQPGAKTVSLVAKKSGKTVSKLKQIDNTGIFSAKVRRKNNFDYLLRISDGVSEKLIEDPYAFPLILGDLDVHLLAHGKHKKPYSKFGAHQITLKGVQGFAFAVWAPNASRVAIIGDFNNWDGRCHPMRLRHDCGVWELFIPDLNIGTHYKYEIKDSHGRILPLKADPYGCQAEFRPQTASVVIQQQDFQWQDQAWLDSRGEHNARNKPISIYEVHLGSWKRKHDNQYLNYRELGEDLVAYVKNMNFTHLQLMPVSEYPYDGSWGYQPVGLFAPTSRFASGQSNVVEDFQYFVNSCHQAGIGLLVDWVPGHFPFDSHGLAEFDGTNLYEHEDLQKGFHPDWNTLIYNYGRTEVANFLRASAFHWLDKFHVDGLRVDAVASMLYLDYSRNPGEWQANEFGGNENLEAVAFLKQFNEELYQDYPGTFSVAEESTSWPGVSRPTDAGGLGFGYKWNMGWMNDSLEYMKRDPIHRKFHQNELSFSLVYAFDENFILPLSHDEVVHGKGSILSRMPGDDWQKFANVRAYYGFMWTHPGKKLLFMGCEFAQSKEWNFDQSLDWHELQNPSHGGVQKMVADLNQLYQSTPALYQKDCESDGFEWIDHQNSELSIYAFIRYGNDRYKPLIVVCNFTPTTHKQFNLGVPKAGFYREVFNTDSAIYGGSNQGNLGGVASSDRHAHNRAQSISITVPPLATVVFQVDS